MTERPSTSQLNPLETILGRDKSVEKNEAGKRVREWGACNFKRVVREARVRGGEGAGCLDIREQRGDQARTAKQLCRQCERTSKEACGAGAERARRGKREPAHSGSGGC